MNVFREFLVKEVGRIGWREFVRRSDGEFTSGALQGWLRGALPLPSHQVAIAKIVDVPLEKIRDLVWQSEKAREEARPLRPFGVAAPVVLAGPPRKPPQRASQPNRQPVAAQAM